MSHPVIGIIAVTTPGAAICAQHLITESATYGLGSAHPEYFIHARPTSDYIAAVNNQDWSLVAEYVIDSVNKLATIGANLFIMPSNTPHIAWNIIEDQLNALNKLRDTKLHFINLITATIDQCIKEHCASVLLLGTAQTMRGDLYKEQCKSKEIICYIPEESEIDFIDSYIKNGLVKNETLPEKTEELIHIINKAYKRAPFDAVILGCTELPMIFSEEFTSQYPYWNSKLKIIDTTAVLAKIAVREAIRLSDEQNQDITSIQALSI